MDDNVVTFLHAFESILACLWLGRVNGLWTRFRSLVYTTAVFAPRSTVFTVTTTALATSSAANALNVRNENINVAAQYFCIRLF